MASKKGKAKAAAKPAPFAIGQHVQVIAGDWGNSRGRVVSLWAGIVGVRLDSQAHIDNALMFKADELRAV